jgi:hypothetical protein
MIKARSTVGQISPQLAKEGFAINEIKFLKGSLDDQAIEIITGKQLQELQADRSRRGT